MDTSWAKDQLHTIVSDNNVSQETTYAARYLTRTLDALHVAAALLLEAKTLASFDDRQRRLAASVGLQLLPETLR